MNCNSVKVYNSPYDFVRGRPYKLNKQSSLSSGSSISLEQEKRQRDLYTMIKDQELKVGEGERGNGKTV